MSSYVVKTTVLVSRAAEKQLRKIPKHIKESLRNWMATVERLGIREARKFPGLHDEPLQGDRKGQRSVRLSKAYRAIYVETIQGLKLLIIEVNKHEY
jgi:proteic killer suppression protein